LALYVSASIVCNGIAVGFWPKPIRDASATARLTVSGLAPPR
jgi:hypothetical protein